jgi:hypothetical protein
LVLAVGSVWLGACGSSSSSDDREFETLVLHEHNVEIAIPPDFTLCTDDDVLADVHQYIYCVGETQPDAYVITVIVYGPAAEFPYDFSRSMSEVRERIAADRQVNLKSIDVERTAVGDGVVVVTEDGTRRTHELWLPRPTGLIHVLGRGSSEDSTDDQTRIFESLTNRIKLIR